MVRAAVGTTHPTVIPTRTLTTTFVRTLMPSPHFVRPGSRLARTRRLRLAGAAQKDVDVRRQGLLGNGPEPLHPLFAGLPRPGRASDEDALVVDEEGLGDPCDAQLPGQLLVRIADDRIRHPVLLDEGAG